MSTTKFEPSTYGVFPTETWLKIITNLPDLRLRIGFEQLNKSFSSLIQNQIAESLVSFEILFESKINREDVARCKTVFHIPAQRFFPDDNTGEWRVMMVSTLDFVSVCGVVVFRDRISEAISALWKRAPYATEIILISSDSRGQKQSTYNSVLSALTHTAKQCLPVRPVSRIIVSGSVSSCPIGSLLEVFKSSLETVHLKDDLDAPCSSNSQLWEAIAKLNQLKSLHAPLLLDGSYNGVVAALQRKRLTELKLFIKHRQGSSVTDGSLASELENLTSMSLKILSILGDDGSFLDALLRMEIRNKQTRGQFVLFDELEDLEGCLSPELLVHIPDLFPSLKRLHWMGYTHASENENDYAALAECIAKFINNHSEEPMLRSLRLISKVADVRNFEELPDQFLRAAKFRRLNEMRRIVSLDSEWPCDPDVNEDHLVWKFCAQNATVFLCLV